MPVFKERGDYKNSASRPKGEAFLPDAQSQKLGFMPGFCDCEQESEQTALLTSGFESRSHAGGRRGGRLTNLAEGGFVSTLAFMNEMK